MGMQARGWRSAAARRVIRRLVAVLLASTLPLGATLVTSANARGGSDGGPAAAYARGLRALGDLPADPARAAVALVAAITGGNGETANAATIELLRRSGMPVVSADGPVIALPNDYVLVDAAVYAELIPSLTASVRVGNALSPDQFGGYLNDLGAYPNELSPGVLVGGLGTWGKDADSGPAERTAGAAIRALSASRGEVLYAEADPGQLHLDMLQLTLVLGTLSFVGRVEAPDPRGLTTGALTAPAGVSGLERLAGVGIASAANPCDAVELALKSPKQPGYGLAAAGAKDAAKRTAAHIFKQWRESDPEALAQRMVDKAEALKKGSKADQIWSKGGKILNILLLYLGATLDVDAKPASLHVMTEGGISQVEVDATAKFSSTLSQGLLSCYALAGIEVPPNGPLAGYKVHWSITQPLVGAGTGKLLRVASGYGEYFMSGGNQAQVTSADGKAKVVLDVVHERTPGKGELKHDKVVVRATLDKDDFPFKWSDLFKLDNPFKFAADKSFDVVVAAVKRKALPSTPVAIDVAYHDSEAYSIRGTRTIIAFFYTMPIALDLWTCEGIGGPWHGTIAFHGDRDWFGDPANKVFGNRFPPTVDQSWSVEFPMRLGPPPTIAGAPQEGRAELIGDLGGIVELDGGWHVLTRTDGSVVGRMILTGSDGTLDSLAVFDGFDASYPIKVGAPDHCPPDNLYFP
ncbi:MAG TPA: hypothetical protein VE011_04405 [Candidatus Dormibacteraeota bacterium]|nr:hypothetical protein [Candidatus Dormibacteraeota bacterium]